MLQSETKEVLGKVPIAHPKILAIFLFLRIGVLIKNREILSQLSNFPMTVEYKLRTLLSLLASLTSVFPINIVSSTNYSLEHKRGWEVGLTL